MGKSGLEQKITDAIEDLCQEIESESGQFVNTSTMFNISVVSSIWGIISSERLDNSDPKLNRIVTDLAKIFKNTTSMLSQIANVSKPLFWICEKSGLTDLRECVRGSFLYIDRVLQEHEESFQEDNMRDFIDYYIQGKSVFVLFCVFINYH